MAGEMGGLWVGPMPVQMFLDTFIPLNPEASNVPQLSPDYFCAMPLEVAHESKLYGPFVSHLTDPLTRILTYLSADRTRRESQNHSRSQDSRHFELCR